MNASELMLNDWIRHIDEKEPGQVYEIRDDFIEIDMNLSKEEQFGWIDGEPDDFEGIPLTEDILNLNGFKYILPHYCDSPQYYYNEELNWTAFCEHSLQYVHEFQHFMKFHGFSEQANNFKIK